MLWQDFFIFFLIFSFCGTSSYNHNNNKDQEQQHLVAAATSAVDSIAEQREQYFTAHGDPSRLLHSVLSCCCLVSFLFVSSLFPFVSTFSKVPSRNSGERCAISLTATSDACGVHR